MFENLFSRYPFFRYIPAIIGMALIFRSSATPGSEMGWLTPPFDKLFHLFVYACLGGAFSLWFRFSFWEKNAIRSILFVLLLGIAYGASDEFHQSFIPGRSASVLDLLADTLGVFLGAIVYYLIIRFKAKNS